MTTEPKAVPRFRFRLNQSWNGNKRGDVIEIGPGLLDALQRGQRGELVDEPETKMVRDGRIKNKAVA